MRRYVVVGTLSLMGASPLLMRCQDEPRYSDEQVETGQLNLPLEAFGPSGNRYRLRDGIFIAERRASGDGSVGSGGADTTFGFGDAESAVSNVTTGFVTTGVGGSFGIAASAVGGNQADGVGGGVFAGIGGGAGEFGVSTVSGITSTNGGFGVGGTTGGGEFEFERALFSEDALFDPILVARLRSGDYRVTLLDGWIMERITPQGDSAFVAAELTSSPVQFTTIFPREPSFISYSFLVDGNQVILGNEGDLLIGIDVEEVSDQSLDRRSLFETNADAVAQFNLEEVLDQLGANAGFEPNGQTLYHQLIDSYASAPGNLETAVHCGDENPGGPDTLNGYPILCDRLEAQQFDNLGSWFATAVVNRIDLAPENGAHCGQQRIIFANNEFIGNGRMFIIVEAQVPNPEPELGLTGCLPIAEFWRSLESVDDPFLRGTLLRGAFLEEGILASGPFMNAANLTAGTGQIRTNNFNHFIWTLREFKLVQDEGQVSVVPFPVAESPHGPLWNDASDFPFGEQCRQSFLSAVDGVLSDNPAEMAFIVDHECKDAESPNDFFTQDYQFHLNNGDPDGFRSELELRLLGTGLTPEDLAARARFAGSCIGCHEEAVGSPLGGGVQAPFSLGFVHVEEGFLEECNDGPCFPISQALRDVFLPHRGRVMSDMLGDGAGGAGGASGSDGFGGSSGFSVTVGGVGFTSVTTGGSVGTSGNRPIEPPGLASAELSVEELVEEDESAKSSWGIRTIGGQPAQVSH